MTLDTYLQITNATKHIYMLTKHLYKYIYGHLSTGIQRGRLKKDRGRGSFLFVKIQNFQKGIKEANENDCLLGRSLWFCGEEDSFSFLLSRLLINVMFYLFHLLLLSLKIHFKKLAKTYTVFGWRNKIFS